MPSLRQDSTYHSLCYISCGALDRMKNRSVSLPWGIDLMTHHTLTEALPQNYIWFHLNWLMGSSTRWSMRKAGVIALDCTPLLTNRVWSALSGWFLSSRPPLLDLCFWSFLLCLSEVDAAQMPRGNAKQNTYINKSHLYDINKTLLWDLKFVTFCKLYCETSCLSHY